MLRKYSNYRSFADNVGLGVLTAFSAGMVNVISVIVFFSFTSNVTGHYAILAQEIAKGNWYQGAVVLIWIFLFFAGNFTSNCLIIHNNTPKGRYVAHAIPVFLEMACLMFVGIYLQYFYTESLQETEILVAAMLFAMGLQNGLTASISNAKVKTTHLTGLTTDLGILFSMFTKKEFRNDKNLTQKAKLLLAIMFSYMAGGILSGVLYYEVQNVTFVIVGMVLGTVLLYDYSKLQVTKFVQRRKSYNRRYILSKKQV
ncbi:YoaK family protein [Flagellimonas iocasae]|uniref:YoaK family protein n=1 Tax=Flagellimonas iocasae TaxID=2055905 RepID=A0ABW4XXL3_9FLAO